MGVAVMINDPIMIVAMMNNPVSVAATVIDPMSVAVMINDSIMIVAMTVAVTMNLCPTKNQRRMTNRSPMMNHPMITQTTTNMDDEGIFDGDGSKEEELYTIDEYLRSRMNNLLQIIYCRVLVLI